MHTEQSKYETMWAHDAYRIMAPGEFHAQKFIELAKPTHENSVADFGCGTGRGALTILALTGASVSAFDFAENALDHEVKESLGDRFRFVQHDLTKPVKEKFSFGYCTDVMEHLPPDSVDAALKNIIESATHVYFAISLTEDHFGELIGEKLHLTVRPFDWWKERLESLHFRIDYSENLDKVAIFYGSAYANGDDLSKLSSINTAHFDLKENIKKNVRLGLDEAKPHQKQSDTTVFLLAGGPSLADFEQHILDFGRTGGLIVTTNGSYNWLLERGVRPAAQVLLDARKFNSRFVTPIVDTCKYLISSQCDHEIVKELPREQTILWHSGDSELVKEALEEEDIGHEWFPVFGGSTVTSRALVLLAMLGFRNVEVYGWDSCLRDKVHHAYNQPENDSSAVIEVMVGNKIFKCHPWMAIQANEFQKVIRYVLGPIEDFNLVVHGDGLIAHIINHSADRSAKGA